MSKGRYRVGLKWDAEAKKWEVIFVIPGMHAPVLTDAQTARALAADLVSAAAKAESEKPPQSH